MYILLMLHVKILMLNFSVEYQVTEWPPNVPKIVSYI